MTEIPIEDPGNVSYGIVKARFGRDIEDGPDLDDIPEYVALKGTVTFTMSVFKTIDKTASPVPIILGRDPIVCKLDPQGYLCSVNSLGEPMYRWVKLTATDDPDLNPTNFEWIVSYALTNAAGKTMKGFESHSIAVPSGSTQDLADFIVPDGSQAIGIPQANALAAAAALSAEEAELRAIAAEAAAASAAASMLDSEELIRSTNATDLDDPDSDLSMGVTANMLEGLTTDGDPRREAVEELVAAGAGPRLFHLDSYNDFFGGGKWITGQGNAGTTLTVSVAAGSSVLPVTSAAGLLAGVQILVGEGTANQKIYTIQSVASNNVTIVGTTAFALANGAAVTPLWTNSSHLTVPGYTALARFIAQAKDDAGDFIIKGTAPKVTYLGNSWISQGLTAWATQLHARIPGAVVVNAGVAGNTSTMLLARFDADVPADSTYVVFNEPGVNDDTGLVSPATQAANLQTLVQKVRALGAIPIYAGHVPLADVTTYSAARQVQADAAIGDGSAFPGTGVASTALGTPYQPDVDSLALGAGALLTVTTGIANTVFGVRAGDAITSGARNVLFGREAGTALTTGTDSVGIGHNALRACVLGVSNVAIGQGAGSALTGSNAVMVGQNAGVSATAGTGDVFIGQAAGFAGGGNAANATTTGVNQTVIGHEAGQGSATQVNGITVVGRRAVASGASASALGTVASAGGAYSAAIGSSTSASAAGSAAIGTDSTAAGAVSTTQDEIGLGTALHTTRIAGWLRLDRGQATVGAAGAAAALPATPAKYLSVKDSAGTEYVLPVYAKA